MKVLLKAGMKVFVMKQNKQTAGMVWKFFEVSDEAEQVNSWNGIKVFWGFEVSDEAKQANSCRFFWFLKFKMKQNKQIAGGFWSFRWSRTANSSDGMEVFDVWNEAKTSNNAAAVGPLCHSTHKIQTNKLQKLAIMILLLKIVILRTTLYHILLTNAVYVVVNTSRNVIPMHKSCHDTDRPEPQDD